MQALLFFLLVLSAPAVAATARQTHIPFAFEPNQGHAPSTVRFLSRTPSHDLWLESGRVTFRSHAVAMRWINGRAGDPAGQSGSIARHFSGATSRAVTQFERVRYRQIYDGIDLVVYWSGSQLEYDFELAPHADPASIVLEFDGARGSIDSSGDLVLDTPSGPLVHKRPVARQGARTIEAAYVLEGSNRARFQLGDYDRSQPLTIDPVVYATYIGGAGTDRISGVAADSAGNTYYTGMTNSTDFRTQNGAQSSFAGGTADAWVVKLDPSGRRVYSTYLGGAGHDEGIRIRIDAEGNAYIAGITRSADFPTTANAPQRQLKGASDAFVVKLSPAGDRLVFSSLVGGTGDESASALLVDRAGIVCLAGSTDALDLATTPDAVQPRNAGRLDGYIAILDPSTGAVSYLTYFGGNGTDTLNGIALGHGGNLYFTGQTDSTNFPVSDTAEQRTLRGPSDAYLVRLSSDRRSVGHATLIGGSQADLGADVAVDYAETVLVTGDTRSPDFPVTVPRPATAVFPAQSVFGAEFVFPRGSGAPDFLIDSSLPAVASKALGSLLRNAVSFLETHEPSKRHSLTFSGTWVNPSTILSNPINAIESDGARCVLVNVSTVPTAGLASQTPLTQAPFFVHFGGRDLPALNGNAIANGVTGAYVSGPTGNIYTSNLTSSVLTATPGAVSYSGGIEGITISISQTASGPLQLDNALLFSVNRSATHEPIFTDTGELFEHELDFALGGRLPLSLVRYYASALNRNRLNTTGLGENWMHNFDARILFSNENARAVVRMFRGKLLDFNRSGGAWVMAQREPYNYQLITEGTNFKLFEPQGEHIYTFNSTGFLTRIEDLNGNALVVTPGPNGPTEVADSIGRSLRFTYTGARLTQVTDQANRSVTFAYNATDLISATDTAGKVTTYSYTSVGERRSLLVRRTFPEGNVPFTQEYDSLGRVSRQADARGNALGLEFNTPAPLLTRITDPTGATSVHRTFFSISSLLDATDPDGKTTFYSYDINARSTGRKDRLGAVTGHVRDTNGNLTSSTDGVGATARFTHLDLRSGPFLFHRRSRAVDADGATREWRYDARGNLTSHTDRASQVWTIAYNDRGWPLTFRTPAGGTTTITYNSDGTPLSVLEPTGVMERYEYDNLKRITRVIHGDTTSRRFAYDAKDHLTSVTDERGKITTYAYDGNGRRTSAQDALGGVTRYAYDANDRRISATNPLGQITRFTYDRIGRVESVTDPAGVVTRLSRDSLGGVREVSDSAGKLISFDRNAEGDLTATTLATGESSKIARDLMRRPTQLTDPAGAATQLRRDALGRLSAVTNPLGDTAEAARDSAGRVANVTSPDGSTTGVGYEAASLPVAVTDPRGNTWKVTRDAAGRVTARTDPAGETETYTYNNRGLLSQETYADGATAAYTYDETGLLARGAYSDGTDIRIVREDLGRVIRANGVTLAYDAAGRVIDSNGVRTTYDPAGRIASVTYPGGDTVRQQYDNRGQLIRLTNWTGGVTEFAYDASLRVTSVRRPNSTASSYAYGNDGRVSAVRHTGPGWEASTEAIRDAAGQIVRVVKNGPAQAPSFDAATQEFAFTSNNRLEGRSYDRRGNLLRDGDREFTWDVRGLLRSLKTPSGSWNIEWDAFGSPIQIGAVSLLWNYATSPPTLVRMESGQAQAAAKGSGRRLAPGLFVDLVYAKGRPAALRSEGITEMVSDLDGIFYYSGGSGAVTSVQQETPGGEVRSTTGENHWANVEGLSLGKYGDISIPNTGISVNQGGAVSDAQTGFGPFTFFANDDGRIVKPGATLHLGVRDEDIRLHNGTNRWRASARFYYENSDLQSGAVTPSIVGQLQSYNREEFYKDYAPADSSNATPFDLFGNGKSNLFRSYGSLYYDSLRDELPRHSFGSNFFGFQPATAFERRGDFSQTVLWRRYFDYALDWSKGGHGNRFGGDLPRLVDGEAEADRFLSTIAQSYGYQPGGGYLLDVPNTSLGGQVNGATTVTMTTFPVPVNDNAFRDDPEGPQDGGTGFIIPRGMRADGSAIY